VSIRTQKSSIQSLFYQNLGKTSCTGSVVSQFMQFPCAYHWECFRSTKSRQRVYSSCGVFMMQMHTSSPIK